VYAKYFGSDDGSNRETIEYIDKCLPYLDATPSLTFVIEAIH
jgi:hypothetical protein